MKNVNIFGLLARPPVNLADGVEYDNAGAATIAVPKGKRYCYVIGGNDTSITIPGVGTLTATGYFTVPAGAGNLTLTLAGNVDAAVSALIYDATDMEAAVEVPSGAGMFRFNVTAVSGGASVVVKIYGYDPLTGTTHLILESAAITATGLTVLRVAPGLTPDANLTVNDFLPSNIKVDVEHSVPGSSITYQMTGCFVDL